MSRPTPARVSPPPGHTGPLPAVPPEARAAARRRAAEFRERFGPEPPLEALLTPDQIAQADAALAARRADQAGRLAPALAALKHAREAAGLTLAQAASRAGVAEETLCKLEGGKLANPTWQTLDRCAAAVGLTLTVTAVPAAG